MASGVTGHFMMVSLAFRLRSVPVGRNSVRPSSPSSVCAGRRREVLVVPAPEGERAGQVRIEGRELLLLGGARDRRVVAVHDERAVVLQREHNGVRHGHAQRPGGLGRLGRCGRRRGRPRFRRGGLLCLRRTRRPDVIREAHHLRDAARGQRAERCDGGDDERAMGDAFSDRHSRSLFIQTDETRQTVNDGELRRWIFDVRGVQLTAPQPQFPS